MQADISRPTDVKRRRSAYCPGPAGSTQGDCVARHIEAQPAYATLPRTTRWFGRALRAFQQHDVWAEMASQTEVFEGLAQGDAAAWHSAIVAIEDRRIAAKESTKTAQHDSLQRRRYQGQGACESVLARFATMKSSCDRLEPSRLVPCAAHLMCVICSPMCSAAGDGITKWTAARAELLSMASGHGLGEFIADKILLELLAGKLVGGYDESGASCWGPGSWTTLCLMVQFVHGGQFVSSWKRSPKDVGEEHMETFNVDLFFAHFKKLLALVVAAYWGERKKRLPDLVKLDKHITVTLLQPKPLMYKAGCDRHSAPLSHTALLGTNSWAVRSLVFFAVGTRATSASCVGGARSRSPTPPRSSRAFQKAPSSFCRLWARSSCSFGGSPQ
jgi:hypothetical protein